MVDTPEAAQSAEIDSGTVIKCEDLRGVFPLVNGGDYWIVEDPIQAGPYFLVLGEVGGVQIADLIVSGIKVISLEEDRQNRFRSSESLLFIPNILLEGGEESMQIVHDAYVEQ